MTKKKEQLSDRFAREMTETADAMHKLGIMDAQAHKLTMRELNRTTSAATVAPLSGAEIRKLREQANMSQAVFAKFLHLTVDHVSKLERGTKRPNGPALVLLNVIRRKGIEAIL
ncbi:helix-turn-helix domain-containing protein [Bradyrhizobium guangzhouense]|uniref:Helix-turn-helix domain-containing protein n=1 Tax=Bradyrhizobium guangzhouense TaxID=1325095 RepID=A0AAE6CBL2_9BRAD|nr:helix-turn-helix domain-containing protein [Bradyrhizobium guangzhouense]QAU49825.1 transcriptional regulator [Bradyrhizobium guangzhouense]RXH17912.1 helix-turn-helix domain-containing protein [Bradyrhizobium guangzhouense]